jgi:TRAP-type C4-dicarboxylate transport system permease small subunit
MAYLAAVTIIVLMLLVVANVCGRYVNKPITGAAELACFLMVVIVFPALAWTAMAGKHVKVGLVVERFSPRVQIIVDCITMLVVLGMYAVITWQSFLKSMEISEVTSMIGLPHEPFYWVMAVGWAVFCLSIIALFLKRIAEAGKR